MDRPRRAREMKMEEPQLNLPDDHPVDEVDAAGKDIDLDAEIHD